MLEQGLEWIAQHRPAMVALVVVLALTLLAGRRWCSGALSSAAAFSSAPATAGIPAHRRRTSGLHRVRAVPAGTGTVLLLRAGRSSPPFSAWAVMPER